MPNALIYCRISSDPKHDLLGVQRQEQECRELATRLGWSVVGVFIDDDVSAYSGKRRPQYEAMLSALTTKVGNAVITWHPDRLHRSPKELESFIDLVEAQRIKVATVQAGEYDLTTPTGRMSARIVGAVARHESEHKGQRVRAKYRQSAERGLPIMGGYRPFGYAKDKVTIVPGEAKMVRTVAGKVLNGETLRSCAAWMNEQGSVTATGVPWNPTMVRDLMVRPRNAGLRATGRRGDTCVVAEATWRPIIDRGTHDRLRLLLLDPARRTSRSARRYLLSSLLVCGECGSKMVARPKSGRVDVDGGVFRQYACVGGPGRPGCGHCTIGAHDLEDFVADAAVARFIRMAEAGAFRNGSVLVDDEISAEIEALDRKAAQLGSDWAADEIGDAAFKAATARLVERRKELEALARRSTRNTPPMLAELAGHPERVRKQWLTMSFDEKRALLMALIESITVTPNTPFKRGFDTARVGEPVWKDLDEK